MPRTEQNYWRRQSKEFRKWVFGSVVWMIAVFVLIFLLDVFNFRRMNDQETLQSFLLMGLPLIVWGIKFAYVRLVK